LFLADLVVLNLLLLIPLITSYANGFGESSIFFFEKWDVFNLSYGMTIDGSMMNGLQSVQKWKDYFGNPSSKDLGLFNAIQSIGALTATPFSPYVADTFGRRTGILVGAVLVLIAAALQTATQNLGMFIGSRFLIGFGISFVSLLFPCLRLDVSSTF